MAVEYKNRTAIYKRAVIGPKKAETLSHLLWRALSMRKTIGERRQKLGESDEHSDWLVIGDYSGAATTVCGTLMRYSPGTPAAALLDDLAAPTVKLSPVKLPADGALRREFVEGMTMFAVTGNHVALMQSVSVRQKSLENHLYWLLQGAGVLGTGQAVSLADTPTSGAKKAARESPVRSVLLSGDFDAVNKVNPEQVRVSRHVWRAFNEMLEADGGNLPLNQLDTSHIGVTVELRYEGRRHEASGAALDRLARVLRHADGVDVEVVLDNGARFKNEQLRTSTTLKVQTIDGVPSLVDAYRAMREWLIDRLEAGDGT